MSKLTAIEMEKVYNPKDFEQRIYEQWLKNNSFEPRESKTGKNFVIALPPPNVTGVLHVGHALDHVLQDIQIRFHRMCGDKTLWIPGTDHAGIATQNVVEKKLATQGRKKKDMSRDEFLAETWKLVDEHKATIQEQMRKLGDSVDWNYERFTLDEGLSEAVRKIFVDLYNRGLLYRGDYLVNWCPRCGTALSDDEVEHTEKSGFMYHIYYPLADGATLKDGSTMLEIATTRPETLLGDTAVAVHPDDTRYNYLKGCSVHLPLTNRKIPIVFDSYVDREFGTGVVKITPAHDVNDWEVGKRHELEVINILRPDAHLNDCVPEKYQGLSIEKARAVVVEDLQAQGLFKESKKISHSVGHCYRCHTTIEPFLSKQWFVKMKPLADRALAAWKNGELIFYPKKWENTYSHWLNNIRDWCISRQLWWGHRIPVWYCSECHAELASEKDIDTCPHCGSHSLTQDEDVLDTWFSSWLWPFSTLGWPEHTDDLKTFYPTTTIITGYDILFFWVSRMIMAGLVATDTVPFTNINIHGLVRDKKGVKMSKSLGNGVDPIEIINTYGADALKFTLSFMCAQGQDVLIDEDSFKFGSKFANKVWNASRYILSNLEGRTIIPVSETELNEADRWVLHSLNEAVRKVRNALTAYKYNDAAQAVYEFFWNDFCDWYVEVTKLSLKNGDEKEKDRTISLLLGVLEESLRLMHPLLPFVSEEIYAKLPECSRLGAEHLFKDLITADYPEWDSCRVCEEAANKFAALQEIVKKIRTLRTECGIEAQVKLRTHLYVDPCSPASAATQYSEVIMMLAGLSELTFLASANEKPEQSIGTVGTGFEAFILAGESLDIDKIIARFDKELLKEETYVAKIEKKLQDKNFIENAPSDIVQKERESIQEKKMRIEKLKQYKKELSSR